MKNRTDKTSDMLRLVEKVVGTKIWNLKNFMIA
jgi:hypothetical protein